MRVTTLCALVLSLALVVGCGSRDPVGPDPARSAGPLAPSEGPCDPIVLPC